MPKTHDCVITTLSIKNMVVGSLVNREKSKIHQGCKGINLNLATFSRFVMPHLGVIDGFVGMEGRGPVSGDPVELRAAAASLYPISLDAVTSKIMGFDLAHPSTMLPDNSNRIHSITKCMTGRSNPTPRRKLYGCRRRLALFLAYPSLGSQVMLASLYAHAI
jgi:uncharacterized protein (DUF362 family)